MLVGNKGAFFGPGPFSRYEVAGVFALSRAGLHLSVAHVRVTLHYLSWIPLDSCPPVRHLFEP